jgi:hypothetical protein
MADEFRTRDVKPRKPRDRSKVNLDHAGERQYWSEKFGVSADELSQAIDRVGESSSAVAKHLTRPPMEES